MKVVTIDIIAKEWFDRVNGNSYFSAQITLNYGMTDSKTIKIGFTGGHSEYYVQKSGEVLKQLLYTDQEKYETGGLKGLGSYCRDAGIILRTGIQTGCLKRTVKDWGE